MTDTALAVMDKGEANRRILGKEEYQADFRRVEAASLKRTTHLASAEGKRLFARCFYTFQAAMYFISQLGRTKLPHEVVETIEQDIKDRLEAATTELNQAIDGADLLFKNNNIEAAATYDTVPMEIEVGITSALGRRYFELIHKLDQVMPLLQTLEIEEVINEREVEKQRSRFKRITLHISTGARNFSDGVRRRMNEVDAKKATPSDPRRKRAAEATDEDGGPIDGSDPSHELASALQTPTEERPSAPPETGTAVLDEGPEPVDEAAVADVN